MFLCGGVKVFSIYVLVLLTPFRKNCSWPLFLQGLRPLSSEELRQDETSYRGREYFVRWEGKAYWHCTWLLPDLLQKKSAAKLNNFIVSGQNEKKNVEFCVAR